LLGGTNHLRRAPSTTNSVEGSFLVDGTLIGDTPIVFTFFPTDGVDFGRYLLADAQPGSTFDNTSPGIEDGCYVRDPSTHALPIDLSASCLGAIDTDDTSGFWDGSGAPVTRKLYPLDNQRLQLLAPSFASQLTR